MSLLPLAKRAAPLGLAILLAGCGVTDTLLPAQMSQRTIEGVQSHQGPVTEADKIKVLPLNSSDLSCPAVDIADGGASVRVGGPDNKSVRYQFDISTVTRNCEPRGAQAAINVGAAGLLLIGPAGSPGTFSTDLKIVVANVVDKKPVYQKSYKITVNTNGGLRGDYQIVMDPIMVPLTRTNLDDQFTITVGLGNSVSAKPAKGPAKGK